MDIGNTEKINVDFVSRNADTDYMDGDICVIDDLRELNFDGFFKMDLYLLLVCTSGRLDVDINGRTYIVEADNLLICTPNMFLRRNYISDDFNAKIVCITHGAVQRMILASKGIWNLAMYIGSNPVFKMDKQFIETLDFYYSILAFKLTHEPVAYNKLIMESLFQALFYELAAFLSSSVDKNRNDIATAQLKQGDLLVQRFVSLLSDSQGTQRSVQYFANQLCVSPKYLTRVCKDSCGKTALEWIHQYTIEVIEQMLKYSDLSIKEISNRMQFPNISFFGKFVKARLGMSPTKYRETLMKANNGKNT